MAEARRNDHAEVQPADALKDAGQELLSLLMQRAAQAATDRVTDLSGRSFGDPRERWNRSNQRVSR